MIELIPVALIGLIFVVVILLATELGKQPARQRIAPRKIRIQQVSVSSPKRSELLTLLNGDQSTAQRLLTHAKQSNPYQSEEWYLEKVISDILRDRR